jgi:endogenous inhibitor of DNA gyrase (YacG/DUF329 family)
VSTEIYRYKCPDCGTEGISRYALDGHRPFYCKDCWRKRRGTGAEEWAQRKA